MREQYLEVTYRKGRPLAAYLYLPRAAGVKSVRTVEAGPGLLVDYGPTGDAIGVEITSPEHVTLDALNRVLRDLGRQGLDPEDVSPLTTAA
jgi:uncharacterized protein YuzE